MKGDTKMTVSRSEIAEKIVVQDNIQGKKVVVPAKTVEKILKQYEAHIINELQAGNTVQLTGFGTFSTRERAARKGRNPQTGEPLDIPSSVVPKFKPGKNFKDNIA